MMVLLSILCISIMVVVVAIRISSIFYPAHIYLLEVCLDKMAKITFTIKRVIVSCF